MKHMIIGQILGVLATVLTFLSYQVNTKKLLLTVQSVATLCTCLSFFFLDATTGFALNLVCLLRNVVFYFQKSKTKLSYISAVILALVMVVLGAMSWQGWISLLMIVALAANTLFLSLGDPQLLRKSILVTSAMVILYNIFVFSLGGIANEAISIISSAIGIFRYRKQKNAPKGGEDTCSK